MRGASEGVAHHPQLVTEDYVASRRAAAFGHTSSSSIQQYTLGSYVVPALDGLQLGATSVLLPPPDVAPSSARRAMRAHLYQDWIRRGAVPSKAERVKTGARVAASLAAVLRSSTFDVPTITLSVECGPWAHNFNEPNYDADDDDDDGDGDDTDNDDGTESMRSMTSSSVRSSSSRRSILPLPDFEEGTPLTDEEEAADAKSTAEEPMWNERFEALKAAAAKKALTPNGSGAQRSPKPDQLQHQQQSKRPVLLSSASKPTTTSSYQRHDSTAGGGKPASSSRRSSPVERSLSRSEAEEPRPTPPPRPTNLTPISPHQRLQRTSSGSSVTRDVLSRSPSPTPAPPSGVPQPMPLLSPKPQQAESDSPVPDEAVRAMTPSDSTADVSDNGRAASSVASPVVSMPPDRTTPSTDCAPPAPTSDAVDRESPIMSAEAEAVAPTPVTAKAKKIPFKATAAALDALEAAFAKRLRDDRDQTRQAASDLDRLIASRHKFIVKSAPPPPPPPAPAPAPTPAPAPSPAPPAGEESTVIIPQGPVKTEPANTNDQSVRVVPAASASHSEAAGPTDSSAAGPTHVETASKPQPDEPKVEPAATQPQQTERAAPQATPAREAPPPAPKQAQDGCCLVA